jgi:hypothetical protein
MNLRALCIVLVVALAGIGIVGCDGEDDRRADPGEGDSPELIARTAECTVKSAADTSLSAAKTVSIRRGSQPRDDYDYWILVGDQRGKVLEEAVCDVNPKQRGAGTCFERGTDEPSLGEPVFGFSGIEWRSPTFELTLSPFTGGNKSATFSCR